MKLLPKSRRGRVAVAAGLAALLALGGYLVLDEYRPWEQPRYRGRPVSWWAARVRLWGPGELLIGPDAAGRYDKAHPWVVAYELSIIADSSERKGARRRGSADFAAVERGQEHRPGGGSDSHSP